MSKIRGRKSKPIVLNKEQRTELERLTRRNRVNRGIAFRTRVILMSADGVPGLRIAKKLRSSNQTLYKKNYQEMTDSGH